MDKQRVYIAGPMRWIPHWNWPAFFRAEDRLREHGYEVVNPARVDRERGIEAPEDGAADGLDMREAMRRDLLAILECDKVAVLPGWDSSRGAIAEVSLANAVGMTVISVETLEPIAWRAPAEIGHEDAPETILEEAARLTSRDRHADYGHPLHDFSRVARIWSGVLLDKLKPDVMVSPEDVALCMVGVKIGRECNKPKRDNRVDGCGYWNTLEMIHQKRMEDAA